MVEKNSSMYSKPNLVSLSLYVIDATSTLLRKQGRLTLVVSRSGLPANLSTRVLIAFSKPNQSILNYFKQTKG